MHALRHQIIDKKSTTTTFLNNCHCFNFLLSLQLTHRIYLGQKFIVVARRRPDQQILENEFYVFVSLSFTFILKHHHYTYFCFSNVTIIFFSLIFQQFTIGPFFLAKPSFPIKTKQLACLSAIYGQTLKAVCLSASFKG